MASDQSEYNGGSENKVKKWIDPFLEAEEEIRALLSNVSNIKYDGNKCREMLRSFAKDSKHRKGFVAAYFAVLQQEDFLEDVEMGYNEEVRSRLEKLGEEYSHLESELGAVYGETYYGQLNPLYSFDSEIQQLGPNNNPLITLWAYSGDTLVFKLRGPPSSLLNTSAGLIHNVDQRLDADDDQYWDLSNDEVGDVLDELDHIEKHIRELRESLEEETDNEIDHDDA